MEQGLFTGQVFSKGIEDTPKINIRKFEEHAYSLRVSALLGIISDIHMVLWVSANSVDVIRLIVFLKFSDVKLGRYFDPF